ncbi:hypothetical protein MMC14_006207 [Varicellaria rhodocarpa]|nr:hypothetical protein [Varicellaria rhodocarpa]
MVSPCPSISPPPTKRRRISPSLNASQLAPSLPVRQITTLKPDHLRILSWNVNGISTFLQPHITTFFSASSSKARQTPSPSLSPSSSPSQTPSAPSLRACLERWRYPQIVCLQEVKIARKDTKTQMSVGNAVKGQATIGGQEKEWGYTAHFSLPRDRYNAQGFGGKVYGVCTLLRNDLISEEHLDVDSDIKEIDWDLEGRVLLVSCPRRKLTVFNVYAVNGTSNPYRSPAAGIVMGTRHDRKRAFHTSLAEECRRYQDNGWSVVIAADLNIARSDLDGWPGRRMAEEHVASRKDFEQKFFEDLRMKDSYRNLWGEERRFSYRGRNVEWGRSADRVDLVLLSSDIEIATLPSKVKEQGDRDEARKRNSEIRLVEADILDNELERGPSDHVPIYVTLDIGSGGDE